MHIPLPSSSSSSLSSRLSSSSSSSSFPAIPRGVYSEETWDGDRLSIAYLTYPKYYYDGGSLRETDCTIQTSSDPDWDWEVTTGIWTLYMKNDGTYQSRFAGRTITRKPVGIGFYNALTKQRVVRRVTNLASWDITVADDTIEWEHAGTGAIFRIRYVHDRAVAIVIIPQVVQDALNAARPGWDEEDTYIGIIYEANLDFLTENTETEDFIWYTSGSSRIRIGGLYVEHADLYTADGSDREEVSHLAWRKRKVYLPKRGLYVEACRLDALDSVDGAIIFNDTDTFQEGVDGYSGCEDTYLSRINRTTNYGSSETIYVAADYSGYNVARGLIRFDLSGELPAWPDPGVHFTSVSLSLYCYDTDVSGEHLRCMMAGVWKGWEELDSNWNQFDVSGGLNWDILGCDHKSDYAYFNSLDGYGYDRTTDWVQKFITVDDEDRWVDFSLDFPGDIRWHLQRQYQDGYYEGFVLDGDWPGFTDYSVWFRSSEYAADITKRPKLILTWVFRSPSSSHSSSSSSYSSSSFSSSSSSFSWGAYDVKFGEYTVLEHLSFEVANPEGVHINRRSVVYNCYSLNSAPTANYPAWYLYEDLAAASFIYCEGVSPNGYGFFSQNTYVGYTDVVFAGCVAHSSNVGIHADRKSVISDSIIFDCATGIYFPGELVRSLEGTIYQCTIRNCTAGIDLGSGGGAGFYFLGNIIDSCDVGITSTYPSLASYIDWNNFSNNALDIATYMASPVMDKGPHTTSIDPAFFDVGANDFRIGQHMMNLGISTYFGSNVVVSDCMSYSNQGAYQRRETIGGDGSVWVVGPDAHSGSAYVLMTPPFAGKHPMEWQFLTPCNAGYQGNLSFWRKGAFGGTFRLYASGPGVSISQVVSVPGAYTQHVSASITPSANGYITVRFRASGGIGNIYIDDFAFSQSSSFSSSSSSS